MNFEDLTAFADLTDDELVDMAANHSYVWEPVDLDYYPDSVESWGTYGLTIDVLQVERTAEGWHALLLEWTTGDGDEDFWGYDPDDDEIEEGLTLVDEDVFPSMDAAEQWCEERDRDRLGV